MNDHSLPSLSRLRELAGYSVADAAQILGLTPAQLQQLEADGVCQDAALLARIQDLYASPTAEADQLMQRFLAVDQPSRGQLFKDYIASLKKD